MPVGARAPLFMVSLALSFGLFRPSAEAIKTSPDLYFTSFTASVSNRTVTYKMTLCNKGSATQAGFNVKLFYNRVSAPGCADTHSTYTNLSGLGAGKCTSATFTRYRCA